ncbi:hypothetical protein FHT08_003595 [Xanthomonas campestris]|nr:hypothetical protein [Xanthomonas sp. CFBP 8151]
MRHLDQGMAGAQRCAHPAPFPLRYNKVPLRIAAAMLK